MTTINLLPDDYVRRSACRRTNVLCIALFAVTMAAVVTAVLVSERSSRHTQQVRDDVDASYAFAAKQIQQMQQLEAQKQTMLDRAEAITSLLERVLRSHLLGIVTNCMPDNTSLVRVDVDTRKVVVAPPKADGSGKFDSMSAARAAADKAAAAAAAKSPTFNVVMEVTGLSSTDVQVARFIAGLARNPLVASVDLVFSQEKLVDKTPLREFQIHVELKTDADAIQDNVQSVAGAFDAGTDITHSTGVGQ